MRRSLGTAVFSGMLGVTLFGIFLTPVFFYVICGLSETRLFMAVAMQWISAVLLGALLGAGVGFSLSRIGLVDPTWRWRPAPAWESSPPWSCKPFIGGSSAPRRPASTNRLFPSQTYPTTTPGIGDVAKPQATHCPLTTDN